MRRLAVIDVEGGDQPLFNEDRSIAVFQNGEIYNYIELRRELEALGHVFRTHSDTEVLAHGYEAWGDAVVEHLNGMWAIRAMGRTPPAVVPVARSTRHQAVALRLGRRVDWSSVPRSRRCSRPAFPPSRTRRCLDAYLAFGFVPEPYSFYRDIVKLPPAHNLIVEPGAAPRLSATGEVPIVDESETRRDEDRIVEEFAALFDDAVRLQMRSDVPFGAFLSGRTRFRQHRDGDGGSDAGCGAHVHDRVRRRAATTSARLARLVATALSHRAHRATSSSRRSRSRTGSAGDRLRRALRATRRRSRPVSCRRVAREAVTVVLTGDGGDEVLSGYTRYQGEKFSQTYGGLPALRAPASAAALGGCGARGASRRHARRELERAAQVLEAANMTFDERVTRKQSWSSAALRAGLLRSGAGRIRPAREFVEEAMQGCPARDAFHRLAWFDYKLMLPSQMLTKVDRMSMRASLEARVPFLDHRLVELMAPVGAQVKLPGFTRKHVLRRALGARLPPELLRAPQARLQRADARVVPGRRRRWHCSQGVVAGGALDDRLRPRGAARGSRRAPARRAPITATCSGSCCNWRLG